MKRALSFRAGAPTVASSCAPASSFARTASIGRAGWHHSASSSEPRYRYRQEREGVKGTPTASVLHSLSYSSRYYSSSNQRKEEDYNNPQKTSNSSIEDGESEQPKVMKTGGLFGIRNLLEEWKPIISPKYLKEDFMAGFTVTMVALPLNLAIAIGSGVPPELGLVTGILAGTTGALFGGQRLGVSGPAAATAMLVSNVVRDFGLTGLAFTTLLCGGLQLLTGLVKAGGVIKFLPSPLIAGFIGGIGGLIISNESSRALGIAKQPGGESLMATLSASDTPFTTMLGLIDPASLGLAALTFATAMTISKKFPRYPAIMIAVAMSTLVQAVLQIPTVEMIGALPASLPAPSMPMLPSSSDMGGIALYSLLFYGIGSMESLLSASALDKLAKAKTPYDANKELVGQGIGNLTCSFFGGLLSTSVIVRSSLSVLAGAKTRRASLVHAGMLLGAVYLASPVFSYIPVPALSGVLITAGYRMLNPTEIKHIYSISPRETVPAAVAFGTLLLSGDLLAGVGLGFLSSVGLNFLKPEGRNSLRWSLSPSHEGTVISNLENHKNEVHVALDGAINFLACLKMDKLLQDITNACKQKPSEVYFDLGDTKMIDVSGGDLFAKLIADLQGRGHEVRVTNASPVNFDVLTKSHIPTNVLV